MTDIEIVGVYDMDGNITWIDSKKFPEPGRSPS